MKKNMDNIKEKIQKLLSLSKSPNENEAALALQKAQELLKRYDLSMEEVFSYTSDNVQEGAVFNGKKVPTWIVWLAGAIAETFGIETYTKCRYSRLNGKRYLRSSHVIFVGFEADLLVAAHCFEYIRRGIESGYRTKRAELKSLGVQKFPRNFKNAYALGFIEAVKEKLAQLARAQRAQEQQAEGFVSNLPVRKQTAIEKYLEDLNLQKRRASRMWLDHSAYQAGLEDGARTSVFRPVHGNGPQPLPKGGVS